MNLTTAFYIDSATGSALSTTGNPDALSFGYSLDRIVAPPSPVLVIQSYLAQLNPDGTINNIFQISTQYPTQIGGVNVNSSGWITCSPSSTACPTPYFNPGWVWSPGVYELIVSVTAVLHGANPGSYYPPSLQMHFDDIGLSLPEQQSSFYVDNTQSSQQGAIGASVCGPAALPPDTCLIDIPAAVDPTQVQSIHLTAQLALTPSAGAETTAYVYIGDVARDTSSPLWVEVGQVTFSSSATLNAIIPASSSSIYVDRLGSVCNPSSPILDSMCFRIYSIGNNGNFDGLTVTISVVLQTWNQSTVVIPVLNNATFPVHLLSAYIAGPDGVTSYSLFGECPPPYPVPNGQQCWVNGGQLVQIPVAYTWATGQTYVVTVTTDKGIVISDTFLSP
jgi:hypothetical protein